MSLTCNVLHIDYLIIGKFISLPFSNENCESSFSLSFEKLLRSSGRKDAKYGVDIIKQTNTNSSFRGGSFFMNQPFLFVVTTSKVFECVRRYSFVSLQGFLCEIGKSKLTGGCSLCTSCIVKGNKVKRPNFC